MSNAEDIKSIQKALKKAFRDWRLFNKLMVRYTELIEYIGDQNEQLAKQGFELIKLEQRLKDVLGIIKRNNHKQELEKINRIEQSLDDSKRWSRKHEEKKVLNQNPFKKLKDRNTALMEYIDNQATELYYQGIEINTLKQCLKDAHNIIKGCKLESELEEFDENLSNLE